MRTAAKPRQSPYVGRRDSNWQGQAYSQLQLLNSTPSMYQSTCAIWCPPSESFTVTEHRIHPRRPSTPRISYADPSMKESFGARTSIVSVMCCSVTMLLRNGGTIKRKCALHMWE